jgi:hypothetical protein
VVYNFWALDEGFFVLDVHFTNPRFCALLDPILYAFPTPEISNLMAVSETNNHG